MNHKLAQLSLSTSNKAGSTGDIFVAQPDSTKESLAGKLFIIVEINSTKIEGLKIINFLIDNINHNYYQNEKIILRERISTLTVEHIFEAALAKINKNFSEYTRNEKTDIKLKDINITVGIIHENEIYFTNNGKNKIFLIYKSKVQETNEKEYQISEIGKQNENDKNQSASQKLFSNVISGKIPPNGFFLFTNEALPEYIGSNQLIKIITTLPPQGAAKQIKQTLLKINSYVSFSAIIIQSMLGKKTESPVLPKTESAQKSINTLNRTEEQTENLLTPSGVINIGKWLKFPLQLFNRVPKNQNVIIKDKIFSKKRTFTKTKKVINAIKNFFIYTFGFLIFLTKNITNKEKLSGIIKNFNQNGGRVKMWIIKLIYSILGGSKKKHNEFREKFDSQMEKIRKITKIENPEIVANLKNLTSAANPKNIILTKGLNKIFSGDSVQKSVYMLDIASKIITTITNLEYPIETLETAAIYDNDIYYLNNSNIVKLDTEKEQLKTMDIALSGKKTVAMSTYNNRLYCLSPENNQIYRYKNNGSVFNEQYAWILEKTDLNSAVDLSIDGYIYVLKNNGEIIKLLKGQISATLNANSIVDPPMENVTKLFVSPELKYIYVLEPINRRLILFDKTGKFLMQYLLPNASDLKDFAVDEKNKIIYFLDNASIYKIGATHFE